MAIELNWKHAGVSREEVEVVAQRAMRRVAELRSVAREKNYSDPAYAVALPFEKKFLVQSTALAKEYRDAELLIVVGIGGSNLGTMAVEEAMRGKNSSGPKILYADTVDAGQIAGIKREIKATAKRGGKVLLNAISKSGSTTETIANFAALYAELKNNYPTPEKRVVVTADPTSKLAAVAKQNKFTLLPIPGEIGGRYSVFSNVSLFPLAVAGVDCKELIRGASEMQTRCFASNWSKNPASINAALMYKQRKHGRRVHNTFYFSNDLESCGKWYAQLLAESIGKKTNTSGRVVREGILPLVSLAGDLHRIGQLFYAGPNNTFHRLIRLRGTEKVEIPANAIKGINNLVPHIQGKQMAAVMNAIINGVEISMAQQGIPFFEISLNDKKEHGIGELLQLQMNETMLLGWLLHVNPFDQPDVELYKEETKKMLMKGH